LLAWSRADLQAYAQAQGLLFRHDPSNNDLSLRRNRLRYEILPLLESFNPQVKASLARTASLLQADAHIVEEAVWAALGRLAEWESESAVYVERAGFLALPEGLQRGLLRALFRDLAPLGTGELSAQQVLKACSFIAENRAPAALNLPAEVWLTLGYDGFSLHLGRDLPYPLGLPHLSKGRVVPLDPASVKRLENGWELYSYWVHEGRSPHVKNEDPFEVTLALPPNAELNLRTRREGDKFTPLGMEGRQKRLSDVFSNLKIPHGLRERVPLLTINDQIAWFVAPSANGIVQRVGAAFAVKPDSADILRLRWRQTEAESSGRA
jgi:tRNA(Ile)-lysidine synthase